MEPFTDQLLSCQACGTVATATGFFATSRCSGGCRAHCSGNRHSDSSLAGFGGGFFCARSGAAAPGPKSQDCPGISGRSCSCANGSRLLRRPAAAADGDGVDADERLGRRGPALRAVCTHRRRWRRDSCCASARNVVSGQQWRIWSVDPAARVDGRLEPAADPCSHLSRRWRRSADRHGIRRHLRATRTGGAGSVVSSRRCIR